MAEMPQDMDLRVRDSGDYVYGEPLGLQSLDPYQYEPLSRDGSEIRVLTLQAGSFEDDILVQLATTPFNASHEARLPYEALSYAWGRPENPVDIHVQNSLGVWTLAVTRNCEIALRYLRRTTKSRTLWIDAICIDQQNLDERAAQVLMMRSIYGKSSLVIVWLGLVSQNSDLALQWIEAVANEITYDKSTMRNRHTGQDARWEKVDSIVATETELDAFADLLDRSYFERLWVWPEVRMGGNFVELKCGKTETHFEKLMTAIYYFAGGYSNDSPAASRLVRRVDFILSLPIQGQNDCLFSLDHVRQCKCSDPRDRIYVSLAFGNPYLELDVAPDYKRAVRDVYVDFILRHLKVSPNLDALNFVGDDAHQGGSAVIEELPSFVPDWSRISKVWRFYIGFCSGNSMASIVSASNECLTVRGVRLGIVRRVVPFECDAVTSNTAEGIHRASSQTLRTLLPRGLDVITFHQLLRVLTNDTYAEHYVPTRHGYPSWNECMEYLQHLFDHSEVETVRSDQFLTQRSFQYVKGRSLFLTDDGRIGLGPQSMQGGDIVAVLLGCRTLSILRPSTNEPDCYKIIGSALCTGLMNGEGILGHLPEQYETVQMYTEQSRTLGSAFRNKVTREVTREDPRLPPLSSEWKDVKEEKYPSYPGLVYEHTRTGETRSGTFDPRLDEDALRTQGVEVEIFRIV